MVHEKKKTKQKKQKKKRRKKREMVFLVPPPPLALPHRLEMKQRVSNEDSQSAVRCLAKKKKTKTMHKKKTKKKHQ